jgi:CRP-like cAMP-binding protein
LEQHETAYNRLRQHVERRIAISDSGFEVLRTFYSPRKIKKKEALVMAGEVCHEQAYIVTGCMRSFLTDEKGNDHVIQFGFEDWYVGDMMSFITGKPADYTIEALEECDVLVFHRDQSDRLFESVPEMERYFRIMIQHAFVAMQGRLISTMSQSAETRYLNLLEKFPGIELRIAQHHIAAYLGITPEALSRVRRKRMGK